MLEPRAQPWGTARPKSRGLKGRDHAASTWRVRPCFGPSGLWGIRLAPDPGLRPGLEHLAASRLADPRSFQIPNLPSPHMTSASSAAIMVAPNEPTATETRVTAPRSRRGRGDPIAADGSSSSVRTSVFTRVTTTVRATIAADSPPSLTPPSRGRVRKRPRIEPRDVRRSQRRASGTVAWSSDTHRSGSPGPR